MMIKKKAFEITVDMKALEEQNITPLPEDKTLLKYKIQERPDRYFWTTGYEADPKLGEKIGFKPANIYCRDEKNGCNDNDPLVFWTDKHVGFWKGWGNNWFQGYSVTPTDQYQLGSSNPSSSSDLKNHFSFLKSNGFTWASAEHFLFWSRDQLLLKGANSDILVLTSTTTPAKQMNIDISNTSPKQAFLKSAKFLKALEFEQRQPWFACNFFVQVKALWLKFTQNQELQKTLLETDDRKIFECSPEDGTYAINPERSFDDGFVLLSQLAAYHDDYFVTGRHEKKPVNILGRGLMVARELIKISQMKKLDTITYADLRQHGSDDITTMVDNENFSNCAQYLEPELALSQISLTSFSVSEGTPRSKPVYIDPATAGNTNAEEEREDSRESREQIAPEQARPLLRTNSKKE